MALYQADTKGPIGVALDQESTDVVEHQGFPLVGPSPRIMELYSRRFDHRQLLDGRNTNADIQRGRSSCPNIRATVCSGDKAHHQYYRYAQYIFFRHAVCLLG